MFHTILYTLVEIIFFEKMILTNDPHSRIDISQFLPWGEKNTSGVSVRIYFHCIIMNTLGDHIKWTRRKKSESIHHFSPKI